MTEPPSRPPLAEQLPDDPPVVQAARRVSHAAPANSKEVEDLLRQANLLRVRGDLAGAVRELRKAVEINPSAGAVHEMLGDILIKAGDAAQALESYLAAQSNGGGPALEAKIARIIVKRDAGRSSSGDEALIRGSGALPIVASALVPGVGLILTGETRSASISLIGWLATLGLMLGVPAIREALPYPIGGGMAHTSSGASFLALFLGLANLGFYVYSLVETARVAKPEGKDG
jgi:tetratricopeptide (TPR) repeat protein